MWSLYNRIDDCSDNGGIFNYSGKPLSPLRFSNGKTQEDVVREVLNAINSGKKIVFIKGVCGSGKSAIALNLARHFKKTSIVVPIKSLQEQYEKDYTKKKFILKKDSNPLKISVIKGRANFPCNFCGGSADNPKAPCVIEIREKNLPLLKEYVSKNPLVDEEDFERVLDFKRMNVAAACPHWSPIMPSRINPKLNGYSKKEYESVFGAEFAIFKRKPGCPYYDQYDSYVDSDVLIFNSKKYLLEMAIGRKPKTELDIIDECDEFLDSFATERKINLSRLQKALVSLEPPTKKMRSALKEIISDLNEVLLNAKPVDCVKLKESKIYPLFERIVENPYLAEEEEDNYYNFVFEAAKSFESISDETYVSLEVFDRGPQANLFSGSREVEVVATLVSINMAQKLKDIVDANNVLVMMSGTLHSEEVLRDIFGIDDFVVIEAETMQPGDIKMYRTGLEKNCSYASFKSGLIDRKTYLKILDMCMAQAKPPTLVHVSAFKDLPSEDENKVYKFENLITQEKLRELQKNNNAVEKFSNREIDVLFTTKCSRGLDFPGEKCNSIVITRFPYPNVKGLFWKILREEQPEKFMEFYLDKARRELIQKISRGVRYVGDSVEVLSPDVRVLNSGIGD
ncbi:hypothetical protein D6829_00295 [Candidatus Pacearchaeota archaeon]|nr:MAG: hypothetical protein D6829_00295 [Candidatus Pacearchaeota archaeon]